MPNTCIFNLVFEIIHIKNNNKKQTKKQQQQKKKKNNNKENNLDSEDSDQPHHPSSLKRSLDSSYALKMDSQGPNAFIREYYWNRQRLENVP